MMGGKKFRIASVAILFAIVMICAAIFSTLTVVTVQKDKATAEKYADHITALNECENRGQSWLAWVDNELIAKVENRDSSVDAPEIITNDGAKGNADKTIIDKNKITGELYAGDMKLEIELEILEGKYSIVKWECSKLWAPDDHINVLE